MPLTLTAFGKNGDWLRVFEVPVPILSDSLCPEDEDEYAKDLQVLRMVLEDADNKLTRREIRAAWPQDYQKPPDTTLWRWLEKAVAQGQVRKDGSGRKNDPFRFWLPEQEEQWRQDPIRCLLMEQEEALRRNAAPGLPPVLGDNSTT
jgi:hypothetical protein